MTLTTNGKNYIAKNFGIGNCWAFAGLTWTAVGIDGSTAQESGGTASIVGRLVNTSVYREVILKSPYVGTFTYALLKAVNDHQDITLSPDVVYIVNNDGYPSGEPKYCISAVPPTPTPTPPPSPTKGTLYVESNPSSASIYINGFYRGLTNTTFTLDPGIYPVEVRKAGYIPKHLTKTVIANQRTTAVFILTSTVAPTPTPTPTPTPLPVSDVPPPERAGIFVFKGPIEGEPTATLNLSELQMRQAADAHFEMNGIKIKNTSEHPIYIAIRIRLFVGERPICPDVGFVFDGMDKTLSYNVRVKTLEVGEEVYYNADFYQPVTILGVHTVCMLIHGAWTRADLLDEIELVPE